MALTPTRTSNLRTAGWLMLTTFTLGLISFVIASLYEKLQFPELSLAELAESAGSDSMPLIAMFFLIIGNLTALIAAVGIAASVKPASLLRALIYTALGAAIEFVLLLLTFMNNPDSTDPVAPFIFHLLSTVALVFILVRKAQLPTRSLVHRSAIVTGAWTITLVIISILIFPFTQYGSATAATEAADVHQLREISNRLLAATNAELTDSKNPKVHAISENQSSITGFEDFDCKFNTTRTYFDADFGDQAKLKTPAPQLVPNKDFDPNAAGFATATGSAGTTGATVDPKNNPYTAASIAASEAYWKDMQARVSQKVGTLPEGWSARYTGKTTFSAILQNKQAREQVTLSLQEDFDGSMLTLFYASADKCRPLDKAPSGTR